MDKVFEDGVRMVYGPCDLAYVLWRFVYQRFCFLPHPPTVMIRSLIGLLLLTALTASAQEARPLVVMNLAAHPDDEDGRTLTYYRHAKDAIAYSVIYTRGEGGQNEIGPELYHALGAIRTDETERAARHLGTQVYFLNFYDFGYSKQADESFDIWGGRDEVTSRIVYLIRKLKPDVIFTNHDTVTVGPRKQHGQHQAVGISGYDAFELAADPAYHPEQLEEEGVDLWQPQRFFWRMWSDPDGVAEVKVPVGDIDTHTDEPYSERAITALFEHASQGMGNFARRLTSPTTNFILFRSATDAPLDPTDLAGNLPVNDTAQPDLAYWVDSGRLPLPEEGLFALSDDLVVPGQRIQLRWDPEKLPQRRLQWRFYGAIDTTLYLSDYSPGIANLIVGPRATPTIPKPVYQYEQYTNHPPVTYALFKAGTTERLAGGHLPLEVAPPLVIETAEDVMRLLPGKNAMQVSLTSYDPSATQVHLSVGVSHDADRTVIYQKQTILPLRKGEQMAHTITFDMPSSLKPGDYTVTLTALPEPSLLAPQATHTQLKARAFEVAVAEGLKVGVIQSYDNTLKQALSELGVAYVMLDSTTLATGNLDDLHTILVDIRAYLVRQDLRVYNDRLLDWVERGGHLIVNYQKTFEWNHGNSDPFMGDLSNPDFAPYPLQLSRDRVTREDAAVAVLLPNHPLFHSPTAIDDSIWKDWVQERGLYFPREYDDRYQELFSMHDPGEAPLKSSTLLASYGQGTYLYTALVWYRQLKVYHPGVYTLFANMISLPLVDGREVDVRQNETGGQR